MGNNPVFKGTIKLLNDIPAHPPQSLSPIYMKLTGFPKIILLKWVDTKTLIQKLFDHFREICGFVFITFTQLSSSCSQRLS